MCDPIPVTLLKITTPIEVNPTDRPYRLAGRDWDTYSSPPSLEGFLSPILQKVLEMIDQSKSVYWV